MDDHVYSRIVRAGMLAAIATLVLVPVVLASPGQVVSHVTVSVECDTAYVATATVIDVDGQPVPEQVVTWSIDAPDTGFEPTESITNAQGEATTSVTSTAPIEGLPITAHAGDVSGQAVLKCFEGGEVTGTVPTTSTAPDGSPTPHGTPAWLLAVVGVAALAGALLALRRSAGVRR
jgi:hypothetical protein